jgi:hypothetical protein
MHVLTRSGKMLVWARSRKGILRDFSRTNTRPIIFKKRAKECCKQSQDPGYFAKINQEYLSIAFMINQDHYRLAR